MIESLLCYTRWWTCDGGKRKRKKRKNEREREKRKLENGEWKYEISARGEFRHTSLSFHFHSFRLSHKIGGGPTPRSRPQTQKENHCAERGEWKITVTPEFFKRKEAPGARLSSSQSAWVFSERERARSSAANKCTPLDRVWEHSHRIPQLRCKVEHFHASQ